MNWFRKGADGKFVWPGYGENMRVLKWMLDRVEGQAEGTEHLFGISPRQEDLEWGGLPFTATQFAMVSEVDRSAWAQELKLHDELFAQLAHHLPVELTQVRQRIAERLKA